jgi:chemotaxis protein MotB
MADNQPAIIVIKKIKKADHGHHGGAWKVAYADFVTAMMAFFLLMWLLNATTEEQKRGISDYFSPQAVSKSASGAGGLLGGQAVSSPGAMSSRTASPSASIELKPTSGADAGDAEEEGGVKSDAEKAALAEREAAENRAFDQAEEEIRQAIEEDPDLQKLAENLLIDRTREGLRIQVIDRKGHPMFALGSARMFERTRKLMAKIAVAIKKLPNQVAIAGHTDAIPFRSGRTGYGNWELSAERANSSRRALVGGGLDAKRVERVVGKAATDPLVPDDPTSARNRRISIVILRDADKKTARAKRDFRRDWTGPRLR